MEKLGDLLKKKREDTGLTLRKVEEITEISNAYLSQLENNKITKPSPTILKKLSEVYDASYHRLMTIAGYPMEIEDKQITFRTSQGLEDLSRNEEKELLDYLRFIRQRRRTQ